MAATPEKKVKNKVVEILKAHGAYYFFPATFGMGRSGVPDIVCCYKGYFIGIECKANGNKTTALQDRELEAIKTAGGVSMVIDEKTVSYVAVVLGMVGQNYHEISAHNKKTKNGC
jgi:Holliday junction resolvase